MRIQILQKKFITVLVFMLMCICALAETKTVTYTVTSTSSVSVTGDAPVGSSAVYSSTYSTKCQLTSGNSMTLTLSGFAAKVISGLSMSVKSNSSNGAGYMTCSIGSAQVVSIESSAFNNENWYGNWSSLYVDITRPIQNVEVKTGEDVVILIHATTSSLYCQSFTISYWDDGLDDVCSLELSGVSPKIFTQYDSFSYDGIVVYATDVKGKKLDVTEGALFSGYDMSKVGEQNVEVTYKGKNAVCSISVKAAQKASELITGSFLGDKSISYKYFNNLFFDNSIPSCYKGKIANTNTGIAIANFDKSDVKYIASTTSGGYLKSVKIHWNSNTSAKSTIQVYGNNNAYAAPINSSGTKIGTLIGTLQYVDGQSVATLDAKCKYKYFMIVSMESTSYMDAIEIEWLLNPYSRFISSDNLGTICLPYNVGCVTGATVYEIAGKETESEGLPTKVYFEEVSSLTAGHPYIFRATADKQVFDMTGTNVSNITSNRNGLYGTFSDYPFSSDVNFSETNYYIINSDNEIQRASSASGVYANRAFIKMDEVPLYEPSSSKERVLVLDENGYSFEEATDISEIISSQKENDVEIYTLGGVKINDLQRGVNIVRMSDGSVKKVLKR